MKSNTKVILCLSGIAALVFCCFFAWYSYIVVSRDSEGGREGSSDDRTATKKNLPRGRWRYLTQEEVNFLKMGSFE